MRFLNALSFDCLNLVHLVISSPTPSTGSSGPLEINGIAPGQAVKAGTELRILTVGDSITVGFKSDKDGGDGNGYRKQLFQDLSADKVVFAGDQSPFPGPFIGDGCVSVVPGTVDYDYYAAWCAKTISYMDDHVNASLAERPNIVLLNAGTNDMSDKAEIATEGNDPTAASQRLGNLIDQIVQACPDATVLVALIIPTCSTTSNQGQRILQFNSLIPGIVKKRASAGKKVLAVDFSGFPSADIHSDDCLHPTNQGYQLMGDMWYDYIHQIPGDWINPPVGADPVRPAVRNLSG